MSSPAASGAEVDHLHAAVVQYLTSRFGIAPGRLQSVGMGESAPMVRTGDEVADQRNRRVQVINLGA